MTGDLIIPMLATPATAGMARSLTDGRLRKWDYFAIIDDALLVVAELVTNAITETPRKEIVLQVSREAAGVIVAVWDSSPRLPQVRPIVELTLDDLCGDDLDDNGGRGLHLVQCLASACGVTPDPAVGGKWVWARLRA
ncbi:ATP-binding protein [Actinomadura fibrosa]|uniref:ATP-binding protein n=1 Tax=Actinomadura fibrosa TaxID=111802 RepID=A0ABW2XTK3_9ACTN|nr:ATP-binding protein [Actinomadura fibrosa]